MLLIHPTNLTIIFKSLIIMLCESMEKLIVQVTGLKKYTLYFHITDY